MGIWAAEQSHRGATECAVLEPGEGEREGYVPNVVYSCGGLVHGGNLVLPFGVADHSIGIAIVSVEDLIGEMV